MRLRTHSDTPVAARPGGLRRPLAAALGLALAGCSPALDWRDVGLPDTELVAALPCRPGRFERLVEVAGVRLQLFMLSCEASGVTYGVATATVPDPGQVEPVLRALRERAAAAIGSADPAVRALNMPGATPFAGNSSAILHGQRPDGQTVTEAIRVFGQGARIFQASALGQSLPEDTLRPFEDGLRFLPRGRAGHPD